MLEMRPISAMRRRATIAPTAPIAIARPERKKTRPRRSEPTAREADGMGGNVYVYISSVSRRALAHLKKVDPILARGIERVGPYRPRMQSEGTHFSAIVRAIMYQQLSGKAAATIHAR